MGYNYFVKLWGYAARATSSATIIKMWRKIFIFIIVRENGKQYQNKDQFF